MLKFLTRLCWTRSVRGGPDVPPTYGISLGVLFTIEARSQMSMYVNVMYFLVSVLASWNISND